MNSDFDSALNAFTKRVSNNAARYDKASTIRTGASRWGIHFIVIGNKSKISIQKTTGNISAGSKATGNLFDRSTWTHVITNAISKM